MATNPRQKARKLVERVISIKSMVQDTKVSALVVSKIHKGIA